MTGDDRTVQVSVSLIRSLHGEPGIGAHHRAVLAALLSIDEPEEDTLGMPYVPGPLPAAEPPCIEDMAPGTTFTACWRGHVEPDQFVVLNDGVRCIAPGRWYGGIATEIRYATDRIDPSTIRDVTPPARRTEG